MKALALLLCGFQVFPALESGSTLLSSLPCLVLVEIIYVFCETSLFVITPLA